MADELTATIPDPELAKLEAMAVEHDTQAAAELSAQPPEPAQPEAAVTKPESEINPDNSETDPEPKKADRPRDELGRFTKTEDGKDIPENERQPAEETKPEQPESEYSKKRRERQDKEKQRQDRSWEALNAEKDRIRQYEAQLQREREELQRAREQRTASNPAQQQPVRYSSADLVQASSEYEARAEQAFTDGDPDAFKENLRLAREARQAAGEVYQLEQQAEQQQRAHRFQTVYSQVMERVLTTDPEKEALCDKNSALSKDVDALLNAEPLFNNIPDGFAKAVQVAKWKRDAGLVSELREELTKAKAEVQRLTKERTPLGAGPTTPIQPRDFNRLSTDDQLKELERMAAQYDEAAAA